MRCTEHSKTGLHSDTISSRIKELRTTISEGVISAEIRRRSWRVQVLQGQVDRMLRLQEARAKMYSNQMGEGARRRVNNAAEEQLAIAEGFDAQVIDGALSPELQERLKSSTPSVRDRDVPKGSVSPGFTQLRCHGMLVKDYRGKNAEQEIWKFDGALEASILNVLKQAAIEEGQWTEKREAQGTVTIELIREKLNSGRQRALADWKRRHPEGDGAIEVVPIS